MQPKNARRKRTGILADTRNLDSIEKTQQRPNLLKYGASGRPEIALLLLGDVFSGTLRAVTRRGEATRSSRSEAET